MQAGYTHPALPAARSPVLTPNKTGVLGPLLPAVARPVIRATAQSPVSVSPQADGSFVYDFGRNMAGVCTLSIPAAAAPVGAVFTLYHGEVGQPAAGLTPHNSRAPERCSCAGALLRRWPRS